MQVCRPVMNSVPVKSSAAERRALDRAQQPGRQAVDAGRRLCDGRRVRRRLGARLPPAFSNGLASRAATSFRQSRPREATSCKGVVLARCRAFEHGAGLNRRAQPSDPVSGDQTMHHGLPARRARLIVDVNWNGRVRIFLRSIAAAHCPIRTRALAAASLRRLAANQGRAHHGPRARRACYLSA